MTYPNAASGIKKIFTAEILCLIGTVVLLIGGLLGVIAVISTSQASDGISDATAVAGLGTVAVVLIGSIVLVVGGIMALIGLISAAKDHSRFKVALYAIIVSVVLAAVSGSFSANPTLQSLLTALSNASSLVSSIFVIQGIIDIARQFNNVDLAERGKSQLTLIVVINVIGILANVCVSFMGGSTASVVAGVLAVIALILSLVQYVLYLLLLGKAKTMLEQN